MTTREESDNGDERSSETYVDSMEEQKRILFLFLDDGEHMCAVVVAVVGERDIQGLLLSLFSFFSFS